MTVPFRSAVPGRPPVRVGLVLPSLVLPAHEADVIDQLRAADFVRFELVVRHRAPPTVEPRAFAWYRRWDRRHRRGADPLAAVDCADRLGDIPCIDLSDPPDAAGRRPIERLCDRELDVLLCLGRRPSYPELIGAARHGLWAYRYDDPADYRDAPPYFWQVYEGDLLSTVALEAIGATGHDARVLCRGVFATAPGWSQVLNERQPRWGSTSCVVQALRDLHAFGAVRDRAVADVSDASGPRRAHHRAPGALQIATWLGRTLVRKTARRLRGRPAGLSWTLGLRTASDTLLDAGTATLDGFRWVEPASGRTWADPFLFAADGARWLFFEEMDEGAERAHLSCASVDAGGRLGTVTPVLTRPYHLSYPHVFRADGGIFMIPESGQNETIDLYRCERFPDRWTLEKTLYRGRAVDTTVWWDGEWYWFFTTLIEPRGRSGALWLFMASSLTGDWTPHRAGPISLDVRVNRGAGAIFRHGSRLVRPSQDGSGHYGRRFGLNGDRHAGSRSVRGAAARHDGAARRIRGYTYVRAGRGPRGRRRLQSDAAGVDKLLTQARRRVNARVAAAAPAGCVRVTVFYASTGLRVVL